MGGKQWRMPASTAAVLALLLGAVVWGLTETFVGAEPWDHKTYWLVSYPVLLIIAGVLGYVSRKRGWLTGILLIVGQALWMFIIDTKQANLLPLTLLALWAISVPAVATAHIGARIRASHPPTDDGTAQGSPPQ